MNEPRQSSTFRALRFAVGVAIAGLMVSVVLAAGSWWLWEREKALLKAATNNEQSARARLDAISRERDDLLGSEDTYRMLSARGAFVPENRVDFIEAMEVLKARHRLTSLEYDLKPQRALKFASGVSYANTDIRASRLQLKASAAHEGLLLGFIDDFRRIERGFFPVERCTLRRPPNLATTTGTAPLIPDLPRIAPDDDDSPPTNAASSPLPPQGVVADCVLEWITLIEKSQPQAPVQTAAPTQPANRPRS